MSPPKSAENQSSTTRKTQEPAPKCPRCDSPNTKFCYYNNYSLSQPRHFCKTCRRYWTNGGALRNVPIGGGCRKNKKMKSSPMHSDVGGLRFFQGISPAMDFQLGGISFPRAHSSPIPNTAQFNQFSPSGNTSNTWSAISSIPNCHPFDTPSTTSSNPPHLGFSNPPEIGSLNLHSSLASSIESLSSINQDLHWRLQEQRLSMLFVGDNQTRNSPQKPHPILFQNLEISNPDGIKTARKDGGVSTEWFFEDSYTETPSRNSNNVNENSRSSSWSGIQAWSDLSQYSSMP